MTVSFARVRTVDGWLVYPLMGLGLLFCALLGVALLLYAGRSEMADVGYGRSRNKSLNGTDTLAGLFRSDGHEVRVAFRLSDELEEWADVIVRFAVRPGPPEDEEAAWYTTWLSSERDRRLVYVPRDYDAQADYWTAVLDGLPQDAPAERRTRARKLRDDARMWPTELPKVSKKVAGPEDWFAVEVPKPNVLKVCKALGGPWAEGIDPLKAAVVRHETFKVESETVLLTGDERALVMAWTRFNDSRVLAVASGTFLLNAALINPARRPLAERLVKWVDEGARGSSLKVAFVEGAGVVGEGMGGRSIFDLLRVPPFGWVAAQMLALGLAACLARAATLGRLRGEPPSGEDRPAAHPEALGDLLARTGQTEPARAQLEIYRQWRRSSATELGRLTK